MRRAPWLAGALILLFLAALVAPLLARFGLRYWPFYAGAAAAILLLAGFLERAWKSRPLPPATSRPSRDARFRVVPGGKGKRKGNGEADPEPDDETDEPRWLM